MDFHDCSNLSIPNTMTLYRPVQLSEPKNSTNILISFVHHVHGIRVDVCVLYLKHQDRKRIFIQVLGVFRYALLYFGLYTLDLAGSSHKRVPESAQNPTKTLGLRLERERQILHFYTSLISSNHFTIQFEEFKIEILSSFEVEKALCNHGFSCCSNLSIPNTLTLYRHVQLSEPKTSTHIPISFLHPLHGIRVDVCVLCLNHQG